MVNNSQHTTMVDTHTHTLNGRSEYTKTHTQKQAWYVLYIAELGREPRNEKN